MTHAERLALYEAAERAILEGAQEYQIGGRRLRHADLKDIRAEITFLKGEIAREEYGTRSYATWAGR